MRTHREMIDEWKKDPEFVAEYDALADEFALFDEMLRARKNAGLTQADVAKKMAPKRPQLHVLKHRDAIKSILLLLPPLKNMQRLSSGYSSDTSLNKRAVLEVFLTKHLSR